MSTEKEDSDIFVGYSKSYRLSIVKLKKVEISKFVGKRVEQNLSRFLYIGFEEFTKFIFLLWRKYPV